MALRKAIILSPVLLLLTIFNMTGISNAFCPVSFFPGDVACDTQGAFKWAGSYAEGEVVSPDSRKELSISGGCPPYSWYVSGNGYWLENDFTHGKDNTVYTDTHIDCSATIAVLDKYGTQLTGYLRAPGKWEMKSEGVCELSGSPTSSNHNSYWHEDYIITGNKKQVQRAGATWRSGGSCREPRPNVNCPGSCEEKCGNGCDECIEYDPWLGQNKQKYEELVYAWPCFGSIVYYEEGECQGKWSMGQICMKVSFLKYYEWECNE